MRHGRDSHHTDTEGVRREDPPADVARMIALAADNVPVGILLVDLACEVILYANPRFFSLWGVEYLEDEMRSHSLCTPRLIDECLRRVEAPHLRDAWCRLCHGGREGLAEEEFPLPDGRCLRGLSRPIPGATGAAVGQTLAFTDITVRKRTETLLHIQRDLAIALTSLVTTDTVMELALDAALRIGSVRKSGGLRNGWGWGVKRDATARSRNR